MAHAFDLELIRESGPHWEIKTGSVAFPVLSYDACNLPAEEKAA